jgi:hypothetical protein
MSFDIVSVSRRDPRAFPERAVAKSTVNRPATDLRSVRTVIAMSKPFQCCCDTSRNDQARNAATASFSVS